jgi:3-oxoacyl-[acyl-carrier-protein] synthase II
LSRRVVVTGVGAVSPIGNTAYDMFESAVNGKSGITAIDRYDTDDAGTKIAGLVKDFDPLDYVDKKEVKKMDLFIQYAIAASDEAVKDAGLTAEEPDADRIGVYIGAGLGGINTIEKYTHVVKERGPKRITPFFIPMVIINLAPGFVSMRFRFQGPNLSVVSACASGTHSIGEAFNAIKLGAADVMVAGGTEATITKLAIGGFNAMKALSTRNDEPERASRPFDKDRDGFVMGEGAGILILEELEHAKKRGAKIYAEVIGYGLNADAFHITTPAEEGAGATKCMDLALKSAGINPEDVDYINAHGTSTYYNDMYETMGIKNVFKDHAYKLAVSSTKSMTGHLLGAAGGVEAVLSVLAVNKGVIPPTINYETPDEGCDLDYVPNTAREKEVRAAMSNSFGFGGTNATLVFKKFD